MDARIVIVVYKPLEGKTNELAELINGHHTMLLKEGLVTARIPVIAQAADGCIIEIFEWKSKETIHQVHSNPAVLALWEKFGKVCAYTTASQVQEFHQMFSDFAPLN